MDFDAENDQNDEQQGGGEEGDAGGDFDDIFGGEGGAEGDSTRYMNDAVIFLVDCRKNMFTKDEDGKTQHELIIEAVSSFMKTKVITSKDDRMSMILYNVDKAHNPLTFKGINLVFPLENPDAEKIKQVLNIPKNFEASYGASDKEFPLFEALWLCTHVFKDVDKKPFTKRIFLFTNEDNPNATDVNQRNQAFSYAKRLTEMNVDIELFPLKKPDGRKFEVRKFYADLIALDPEDASAGSLDTSNRITELTKRIRQKIYKKRQLGSIDFMVAPGIKIGVRFYAMIHSAKKPTPINLDSRTNKKLTTVSKQLCGETGSVLHKDQISLFYPLGDEKVLFKKDDIAEIKKFDEPSLKLMGFKPKSRVKTYHNIRSSYFIYPDDDRIIGSSQLCDAMIKQLAAKDKVAIVRFVPRSTSQVRFCALIPQIEAFDENNFQTPPGFNLIFLPFAEDIRKLETVKPQSKIEIERNMVVNAKLLIKSLSIDFDCRNFENPDLQTFFSNLQAIALNENEPEAIDDLLEPDVDGMGKYSTVVDNFKDIIWTGAYNDPDAGNVGAAPKAPRKKKADDGSDLDAPKTKQVKKNATKEKYDRTDMDDSDDGGRKKKIAPAGKKGGKGKKDDSDGDDYDFDDGFLVDDRAVDSKKKKTSKKFSNDDDDGDGGDDIVSKLQQGEIKKITIPELKEYLKSKGLPVGGKKDELVDRAMKALFK